MRLVSLALFLAASVLAQTPPATVDVTATPATVVTTAPAKTCSIPLTDVAPPGAQAIDRQMVVPPRPNSAPSTMRYVTPPAPPCEKAELPNGLVALKLQGKDLFTVLREDAVKHPQAGAGTPAK